MSDEAIEEGGGGGGGGGSALKKYGPLALIVLVAQVVLAWVVLTVAVGDRLGSRESEGQLIEADPTSEKPEEEESEGLPFLYSNPALKITVNPAGTNANRYAVVSVQLGLAGNNESERLTPEELAADTGAQDLILQNLGLIQNILLARLRASHIDEFEGDLPGIMEEVKDQLNRDVFERIKWDDKGEKKIWVKKVIATELVIQ